MNSVKQAAKDLNLTYKQLGEAIGYSSEAISKAANAKHISRPLMRAIEMYREIVLLRQSLNDDYKIKAYDEIRRVVFSYEQHKGGL